MKRLLGWMKRHKVISAIIVLFVFGCTVRACSNSVKDKSSTSESDSTIKSEETSSEVTSIDENEEHISEVSVSETESDTEEDRTGSHPIYQFKNDYFQFDNSIILDDIKLTPSSLYGDGTMNGLAFHISYIDSDPTRITVSIYGYENDLESMEQSAIWCSQVFDSELTDSELQNYIDDIIGTEGMCTPSDKVRIITSAPNEYEDYYRIDVYGYGYYIP